jgi:phosphatidylserine/phosphatidylglycerophosphate/cardiolipin synthase-like enzyme
MYIHILRQIESKELLRWLVLLVLTWGMAACQLPDGASLMPTPAAEPVPLEAVPGWIEVYFTDPGGPDSNSLRGGPDRALAEAIDSARLSVDMAIYELNLWSLRDALLRAHRRGLVVRVVTESDTSDSPEIEALKQALIPVLGDRREGLMHDKFVIIDRSQVWTGSMNFTLNGAYHNDNNLIQVRSTRLAENYLVEFDEMFVADLFGPASIANTPDPRFRLDNTGLEIYFSPDDGTASRLVDLIRAAQTEIHFLAYSFTSDEIAQALIERAEAGVVITGIMDASQVNSNPGTEFERLQTAGVDVRLDGNPDKMHHKVLLIDREIVITGSYNFSASAENNNDENTLVIYSTPLARRFLAEFQRIFDLARP